MKDIIEHCLYESGLTAQGCWDELDDYAKEAIERFARLLVQDSKRLEWLIDNLEWASIKLAMLSSKQKNWRIEIDKAIKRDAVLQELADQAQEWEIK